MNSLALLPKGFLRKVRGGPKAPNLLWGFAEGTIYFSSDFLFPALKRGAIHLYITFRENTHETPSR